MMLGAPGAQYQQKLSTWYFDRLLALNPRTCQELPVSIVDIDDASLEAIGQWPWPRRRIAELVHRIGEAGAAVIVLDMVFSESDRFSAGSLVNIWPEAQTAVGGIPDFDQELANTLSSYDTVGATALVGEPNNKLPSTKAGFAMLGNVPMNYLPIFQGALINIPVIEGALSGIGSISTIPGDDSFVRSVPLVQLLHEKRIPGLIAEAVRVVQGADTFILKSDPAWLAAGDIADFTIGGLSVPMTRDGQMRMHFSRCPPEIISAKSLLSKNTNNSVGLENKIVLIGSSAAVLGDVVTLPSGQMIPGVQVQAQALEQMLQSWFVYRPSQVIWLEWASILLGSLAILFLLRKGVVAALFSLLLFSSFLFGVSWWQLVTNRLLLDALTPTIAVAIVLGAQSLFAFIFSERERIWIRRAFAQYLSPALVQQLADTPERLKLGGEKREMTFLFTDIAGFTALTERTPASQLVSLLNTYLDGVCGVVMEHGGTIDKIVGDAIHAVFNAPLDQPDHAERAIKCAIALDHFSEEFRKTPEARGAEFGMTRIGINSGEAIVGNFGGSQRFDYTAHGDAINTAARLEAANKSLGTRICVAETTVNLAPQKDFRPVGDLLLKGKSKTVLVYEPLECDDHLRAKAGEYLAAWNLLNTDHEAALEAFEKLGIRYPGDPLVIFQLRRLKQGTWASVINLDAHESSPEMRCVQP